MSGTLMSGVDIDRRELWRQSIGEAATESREGRRACGQRPEDGTRPRDLQVHRGDWVPARARCADRHALLCGLHRSLSHDSWCSVVTARTSDTWSAAADTLPTLLLTLSQTLVIIDCHCMLLYSLLYRSPPPWSQLLFPTRFICLFVQKNSH